MCCIGGFTGDIDQPRAQQVLVPAATGPHTLLVPGQGALDEPRLPEHALGAAIARGIATDRFLDQFGEALDRLRLAPQLVVELEHLGDEARPDPKRQIRDSRRGVERGGLCDRLPFVGGQAPRRVES